MGQLLSVRLILLLKCTVFEYFLQNLSVFGKTVIKLSVTRRTDGNKIFLFVKNRKRFVVIYINYVTMNESISFLAYTTLTYKFYFLFCRY